MQLKFGQNFIPDGRFSFNLHKNVEWKNYTAITSDGDLYGLLRISNGGPAQRIRCESRRPTSQQSPRYNKVKGTILARAKQRLG